MRCGRTGKPFTVKVTEDEKTAEDYNNVGDWHQDGRHGIGEGRVNMETCHWKGSLLGCACSRRSVRPKRRATVPKLP